MGIAGAAVTPSIPYRSSPRSRNDRAGRRAVDHGSGPDAEDHSCVRDVARVPLAVRDTGGSIRTRPPRPRCRCRPRRTPRGCDPGSRSRTCRAPDGPGPTTMRLRRDLPTHTRSSVNASRRSMPGVVSSGTVNSSGARDCGCLMSVSLRRGRAYPRLRRKGGTPPRRGPTPTTPRPRQQGAAFHLGRSSIPRDGARSREVCEGGARCASPPRPTSPRASS